MVVKLQTATAPAANANANAKAKPAKAPKAKALLSVANVADVEKYAKQIVAGHGKARGLAQDLSLAVIDHMSQHGDYTIVYPLTDAVKSMGRNFYAPWLNWMQQHSWLRIKPGLKGAAISRATPNDLWSRDASMKPADNKPLLEKAKANRTVKRGRSTVTEPNTFWNYKAPANDNADEQREVNVPDSIARFIKRMQDAINDGTARDENGKEMTYAAIVKMCKDQVATLKPREVKAGAETPKAAAA